METARSAIRQSENNGDYILLAEGVTKYYKHMAANNRITVAIPRGKIVGFVGENGSGKTTFLRVITGLIRPNAGTFRFPTADGKCRLGAIVEAPAYHPNMSARDNLRFQARLCGVDESRIDEILKTVGLSDTGKKAAKHFSLGMRQRLGIGIALLSDPELLILDEPTNGLDPQGIIELREIMKSLSADRNMTLIISSHILSELSLLAEHYLFIHKGEIVTSVSAEKLFAQSEKRLMFRCERDPSAFMKSATENGWVVDAATEDGVCVLYGPKNYPAILEALSRLEVTALETKEETLETRYLSLMEKEEQQ
jgi:ABC-2 type transport system ATP-binding protein